MYVTVHTYITDTKYEEESISFAQPFEISITTKNLCIPPPPALIYIDPNPVSS